MNGWWRLKNEKPGAHQASITSFVRFAAIAIVVVIVIVAVDEASRTDDASQPVAPATTKRDPLAVELLRCRTITAEQLAADDSCRRAWAENRRRFFAPHAPVTRTPETSPKAPDKTQDRIPSTPSHEAR
jgi:conjugative transfer region protein TrbK